MHKIDLHLFLSILFSLSIQAGLPGTVAGPRAVTTEAADQGKPCTGSFATSTARGTEQNF